MKLYKKNKKTLLVFVLISTLMPFMSALAQDANTATAVVQENDRESQQNVEILTRGEEKGWMLIPFAEYPEYEQLYWGFDLYHYLHYPHLASTRPSLFGLGGRFGNFDAMEFTLTGDIYVRDNDWHLLGKLSLRSKYPLFRDVKPYGISSYGSSTLYFSNLVSALRVERKIWQSIYLGFGYRIWSGEIEAENNLFEEWGYLGTDGGAVSGVELAFSYDSRDSGFSPLKGSLLGMSYFISKKAVGSDYNYYLLNLDLRKYFNPRGDHRLAIRMAGEMSRGDVPIFELPDLGGKDGLRALERGVYIDRNMLSLQSEYGMPLFNRFGIIFFAGAGEVFSSFNDFTIADMNYSIGGGFRYKLDEGIRSKIHLDFAGGNKNNFNLVFGAFERF